MFTYIRLREWDKAAEVAKNCVGCNLCEISCPWGLPGTPAIEEARWRKPLEELSPTREAIRKFGSPFPKPAEKRFSWLESVSKRIEPYARATDLFGRCALFVGCTYAFSAVEAAKAAYTTLLEAGLDVVVCPEERCCGAVLVRAGMYDATLPLVEENVRSFEAMRIDTLITLCPLCDLAWRRDYPVLVGRPAFRVLHYSEVFARLVEEGVVEFSKSVEAVATYHDPCHLALGPKRVVEQPREVLRRIPGVKLVEMLRRGEHTRCCGSTLRLYNFSLARRLSEARVQDAQKVEAEVLVTQCPFCTTNLEGASRRLKAGVRVVELYQLVSEAGVRRV